jgi:hypothetical protein
LGEAHGGARRDCLTSPPPPRPSRPQLEDKYTPAAGSPVIDKGSTPYTAPETTDFLGKPRVVGGRVDMGAVEVQPANTGSGGPPGGSIFNRSPFWLGDGLPQLMGLNQVRGQTEQCAAARTRTVPPSAVAPQQ